MSGYRWLAVSALAIPVVVVLLPGQAPGGKGRKKMEGIMVTASAVRPAVLPGESLVVKSTVQNRGNGTVTVPSEQGASLLSYHLQPDGPHARAAYDVSSETYYTQTQIGLAPAGQLEANEDLPPNGVQMRNEDIALYHPEGFAAGKYRLTAAWTHGGYQAVSGFTRVVVAEPRIEAWSSEMCRRTESLHSVFAHRREDGELVIYERSSRTNRPQFGVFRPRVRLDKNTKVESVAPGVVLEDSGQGVWFAWIASGKLQVAGALADELNAQPPAQATGLSNARLVAPGFQLGPGRAAFFVAGKGSEGGTALELWGVSSSGIRRFWQAPLGPASGIRVLARKGNGSPEFVVIFEEQVGAGSRLWRRDYDLRGLRGEARRLAEFGKPLLAWYVESTDYPSPARLVATHRGNTEQDIQARVVDLDGKGAEAPLSFPPMTGSPDLWAAISFDGRLHVAARNGDKILYGEPGWTTWKQVGITATGSGWLGLLSPHSIKLWAEWCTVNRGPLRTQLLQTRDSID